MRSTLRITVVGALAVASILALSGCNLESSSGSSGAATQGIGSSTSNAARQTNVTISWLPPTTNSNGSALTNLAGYRIHYGTAATALTSQIDIPTTGVTDYVVDNLRTSTTYYFAISSYNSQGVESNYSPVVSLTPE